MTLPIRRTISLPKTPDHSFFLWGPRQSGKSLLLRTLYPKAKWYDLLQTDLYMKLIREPHLLRSELLQYNQDTGKKLVVIDEIQKIPLLLDEVHWLIENKQFIFVLCGSSARKLRRGHANLLGGRALRRELSGFVSHEFGEKFKLDKALNDGYLPRHYLNSQTKGMMQSYVNDYLKEEIAAEALVRNLPAFSHFLAAAALSDTEIINYATIARDCGVSNPTVKEYFQIMQDTMLGTVLPAYRKRAKRRVIEKDKFYFSDVGVVNHLAKRGKMVAGSELFGKAFENWIFHELSSYKSYNELDFDIGYWRTASGIEVDFVINDVQITIEAKASSRITSDRLKGQREIIADYPNVERRIVVCLEKSARITDDAIEILPHSDFMVKLWGHKIIN